MIIEKVTRNNLLLIQELAYDIWPKTYSEIISAAQIAFMLDTMYAVEILEQQFNLGHHFLMAKNDTKYIGFAHFQENYSKPQQTKLHKIYFLHETQGNGFGKIMINFIVDFIKQGDQKTLILNVNKFNKAVDFYKKIGFEVDKEEIIELGNGFIMDDFVMKLQL